MKAYKLTDNNMRTHDGFRWKIGETKTLSGNGGLCTNSWLHYYSDPILAIMFNPIHAGIIRPRLFEVKAEGKHKHGRGLKLGCTRLTLIKELDVPQVSHTQRVAFGILCVKEVYDNPSWVRWANDWLNNIDRSSTTADYAAANICITYANTYANTYAYAIYADAAYFAATYAAYVATTYATTNICITNAYAIAATYVVDTTYTVDNINLNLIELAQKAMEY